ncbi:uncharacterized protein LOC130589473 [Beta vulgaris subsp. vulgaris]|uniref:uncharacterized protein LOC130589473 n=1 Tax=Beta vulgaris subsp. vulgaris TaxID=3555 RepID=UPI00254789C3|nr:uncharacterized protein LOC130589473 [Beta vulgaris subsp. vulgaris]
MEKIAKYNPKAVEYLEKCTEQWSRAFFDCGVCCDHNTTNFVESFNACTKPYRDLPVLTLLEEIRIWCMKRTGARFDKAVYIGPTDLTDYAKRILETRSDESRFCYATSCGGGEYEVRDGNVNFPITLTNYKCGCGKWQGSGIPCKHALRVIFNQRLEPADFVSPFFKGAAYKLTYGDHIHPMPDPTQWPDFNLLKLHHLISRDHLADLSSKEREGLMKLKKGRGTTQLGAKNARKWATTPEPVGLIKGRGKASPFIYTEWVRAILSFSVL